MISFEEFDARIMCIGGAQGSKTVEILYEIDNSRFLCFFDSLTFGEKAENHEISKFIWRYPQRHFGDFH